MSSIQDVGSAEARLAIAAIESALLPPEGDINLATEADIQNALHALRSTSANKELISWLEAIAATIRLLAEAKRAGRTNLYMSQLLRLRRRVFA